MKFLDSLYQHINILSLDVVAGAVICSLFFARLLDAPVQPNELVALALTVWIIYTLDHLRDAMTIPKIASTDRHRFHQKHFRIIALVLTVIAAVDLFIVWFIADNIFRAGFLLGFAVLAYLIFQRYLKFLKEFFVACLYTTGILLPSLASPAIDITPIHYLIVGKFLLTALINLLLFSLFDHEEDRHHQQHSFVTWFGPRSTRYGIIFLGLLNILTGLWLWRFDAGVALVFIGMNSLLLTVLFMRKKLHVNNYYRILGDAVFFIPAFYLL
jgi:4-hydroxybenzoate polyprenyltransferase